MGIVIIEGNDIFEVDVAVSTNGVVGKSAGFGADVAIERDQPDSANRRQDSNNIALRNPSGRGRSAEESLDHAIAEDDKRNKAHNKRKTANAAMRVAHVVVISVVLSERKDHTSIFHG